MNRHEMLLVLILSVPRQIMNPKAGFLITAGSLSGIVDVSTAGYSKPPLIDCPVYQPDGFSVIPRVSWTFLCNLGRHDGRGYRNKSNGAFDEISVMLRCVMR
jgi:hypothetical protein